MGQACDVAFWNERLQLREEERKDEEEYEERREGDASAEAKVADTGRSFVSSQEPLQRTRESLISKSNNAAMAFVSNSAGMSVWFEQFFEVPGRGNITHLSWLF